MLRNPGLLFTILFFLAAFAAEARAQSTPPVKPPPKNTKPAKPLEPLVCEDAKAAFELAEKREQTVVAAVGMGAGGEIPAIFKDASVARASRILAPLVSLEYFEEDDFFKSRRITRDKTPCILVLDPYGNVMEILPDKVEPRVLVASMRNARALMLAVREELAAIVPEAKRLAEAKDEGAFLKLVAPWLAKHYRGYPELESLLKLTAEFGKERLSKATEAGGDEALARLESVAKDYAGTPVEAGALLEMARIHETGKKNRDRAKELLKKIVDGLPWPENAESHAAAKVMLAEFRKEEIKRRQEELDKKKD